MGDVSAAIAGSGALVVCVVLAVLAVAIWAAWNGRP